MGADQVGQQGVHGLIDVHGGPLHGGPVAGIVEVVVIDAHVEEAVGPQQHGAVYLKE